MIARNVIRQIGLQFKAEAADRADYEELCADIDRDESEDRKGGVPLFYVAVWAYNDTNEGEHT